MPTLERRATASKRARIDAETWKQVLNRANHKCEWKEGGVSCGLKEGDIDSVGGGTVKLTPDHKRPHSVDPESDPKDADAYFSRGTMGMPFDNSFLLVIFAPILAARVVMKSK